MEPRPIQRVSRSNMYLNVYYTNKTRSQYRHLFCLFMMLASTNPQCEHHNNRAPIENEGCTSHAHLLKLHMRAYL